MKAAKKGEKIVTDEDVAFKAKQKADAAAMKKAAGKLWWEDASSRSVL